MTSRRPLLPEITLHVKTTWQPTRHAHSAGGVAYRHGVNETEVALIATQGGTRWQLPKGTAEAGETPQQTALREVEEEVGLRTVVEDFLQTIEYWYWDTHRKPTPELVHKTVDFYLLRTVSGELSDASYEVDAVGWFTPQQAV
ncbi:MAG: NUDIX domain-containing protein, partial [Chloroflexota bacterium]|nr:NUDIX domain-containing protein [Chloroflexota bacterium]